MYSFMIGTAVAYFTMLTSTVSEDPKGPDAKSLDGAWTVVCFEKDGQPQDDAKGMTVKADAGTITCSGRDGKPAMTFKVAFGPNGTVQVIEGTGDASATAARAGVYVYTQHYLAISLNGDAAPAAGESKLAVDGPTAKSRCSLILKRDGVRTGRQN